MNAAEYEMGKSVSQWATKDELEKVYMESKSDPRDELLLKSFSMHVKIYSYG